MCVYTHEFVTCDARLIPVRVQFIPLPLPGEMTPKSHVNRAGGRPSYHPSFPGPGHPVIHPGTHPCISGSQYSTAVVAVPDLTLDHLDLELKVLLRDGAVLAACLPLPVSESGCHPSIEWRSGSDSRSVSPPSRLTSLCSPHVQAAQPPHLPPKLLLAAAEDWAGQPAAPLALGPLLSPPPRRRAAADAVAHPERRVEPRRRRLAILDVGRRTRGRPRRGRRLWRWRRG